MDAVEGDEKMIQEHAKAALVEAREWLLVGWCQRADAVTSTKSNGMGDRKPQTTAEAESDKAKGWSPVGALKRALKKHWNEPIYHDVWFTAVKAMRLAARTGSIQSWNDNPRRTQEDALAMMHDAIQIVGAQQ